jgi:hypothetical protein
VISKQTLEIPKFVLTLPIPVTLIGKQVAVAPLSGMTPPPPLKVWEKTERLLSVKKEKNNKILNLIYFILFF